jgi:hypothetical protein
MFEVEVAGRDSEHVLIRDLKLSDVQTGME